MNEQLRIRQLAGLSTDRSALLVGNKPINNSETIKQDLLPKVISLKESYNLLRKLAGIPVIEDEAAPEPIPEPEPTDSPAPEEGEPEEETLPAIIKKIAKAVEGKTGEELEESLMKVYNAGIEDGKKQALEDKETPPEGDLQPEPEGEGAEEENSDDIKEGVKVIMKGGSIGSKPSEGS